MSTITSTMPRCDSPQLRWTSFARLPPRKPPSRSPSPCPLDGSPYSEASSTLSDSLIFITPESSLLPDKDNVDDYVSSPESKPSPSLICDSPELLPHNISVALKDELPACPSHARMLDRFLPDPVCDLSEEVELTEQFSVAHGGFSDIYKGVWTRSFCGEKRKTAVCVYFISTKLGSRLMIVAVLTGGNKIASSLHEAGGGPCPSTKGG